MTRLDRWLEEHSFGGWIEESVDTLRPLLRDLLDREREACGELRAVAAAVVREAIEGGTDNAVLAARIGTLAAALSASPEMDCAKPRQAREQDSGVDPGAVTAARRNRREEVSPQGATGDADASTTLSCSRAADNSRAPTDEQARAAAGMLDEEGHGTLPDEIDVDQVVDANGVRFIGMARRQPDGMYRALANVGGALCVVEARITPKTEP